MVSLPADACSRNNASITCAARTMCANASRSFGGSAVISAVRSVGAKRADLVWRSVTAWSTAGVGAGGGVDGACALQAARVAMRDDAATAMTTRFITGHVCIVGGIAALLAR